MTQNLGTEKIISQQQSTQVSNGYQLQRWLSQPKYEDSWVPMECIIGLNECVYPKTSRVKGNKGDTSSNCATQSSIQESRRNNSDGVVSDSLYTLLYHVKLFRLIARWQHMLKAATLNQKLDCWITQRPSALFQAGHQNMD
ncbi:hypothetical protein J3E69DRAFT_68929 [Trichoderma sp. SZMC 28015]